MSDVFSNPGNAAYFADLGITIEPAGAMHVEPWRPNPILGFVPVVGINRGTTGLGIRRVAEISSIIAYAENTALVDQAWPAITTIDPSVGGRGYSLSHTSQGMLRVSGPNWDKMSAVMQELVLRAIVNDITHGSTNGIMQLAASITDVTDDAAGNATLEGLLNCVLKTGRPSVAFYDPVGIRGLIDSIRADGAYFASQGLSDSVRRMADAFQDDQIASAGFFAEIFGCRIHQTVDRDRGAGLTGLYENGGVTHALVMSDFRRRMDAGSVGGMNQYANTAPPIVLEGYYDCIPGLRAVQEPEPQWKVIENTALAGMFPEHGSQIGIARWADVGNNVAGAKDDFGVIFDPILTNGDLARCHQYQTAYVV
jgi:hypothetical protein